MTTADRIRFICGDCGYRARIPAKYSGQTIKCPGCSKPQTAAPAEEAPESGNTVAITKVEAGDAQPADDKFRFICADCGYRARIPVKYNGMAIKCPGCAKPQMATPEAESGDATGNTVEIRKVDVGKGNDKFLFQCAECGYRARLPNKYEGKTIKCPGCSAAQQAVAEDESGPSTGNTVNLKQVDEAQDELFDVSITPAGGVPAIPAAMEAEAMAKASAGVDLGDPEPAAAQPDELTFDETPAEGIATTPAGDAPEADAPPADEKIEFDPFARDEASPEDSGEAKALLEEMRSSRKSKRKSKPREPAITAAPAPAPEPAAPAPAPEPEPEPIAAAPAPEPEPAAPEAEADDIDSLLAADNDADVFAAAPEPEPEPELEAESEPAPKAKRKPPRARDPEPVAAAPAKGGGGTLWLALFVVALLAAGGLGFMWMQASNAMKDAQAAQAAAEQALAAEEQKHTTTKGELSTEKDEHSETRGELSRTQASLDATTADLEKERELHQAARDDLGEAKAKLDLASSELETTKEQLETTIAKRDELQQANDELNKMFEAAKEAENNAEEDGPNEPFTLYGFIVGLFQGLFEFLASLFGF